ALSLRNCPTASKLTPGRCVPLLSTLDTIIGWPWHLRLPGSASLRRTSPAHTSSTSPIPAFSSCSPRARHDDRQDLPRRLHGGGQDDRRGPSWPPARLARRGHRPADRSA